MRLLVMVGAMAALAACEPDMPTAPDPVGPGGREVTALGEAAEKTCAEVTGYAPDKLPAMTSEMRALVTREYNSCVAKVGAEAP